MMVVVTPDFAGSKPAPAPKAEDKKKSTKK